MFFLLFGLVSFRIGIQYGVYQQRIIDSPNKAFVATVQLQHLDKEKYDLIRAIQKNILTNEIINYGKYLDHGKPWIFWPYTPNESDDITGIKKTPDEYIKMSLRYRKEQEFQMPIDLSMCTDDYKKSDLCKRIIENQSYYDKAISTLD